MNNYKITETAIKTLGRKERYVMVIHNGLILAPDFLYFMSQLVTVADVDQSIMGISAWNINGNDAALRICPNSSLIDFSSSVIATLKILKLINAAIPKNFQV